MFVMRYFARNLDILCGLTSIINRKLFMGACMMVNAKETNYIDKNNEANKQQSLTRQIQAELSSPNPPDIEESTPKKSALDKAVSGKQKNIKGALKKVDSKTKNSDEFSGESIRIEVLEPSVRNRKAKSTLKPPKKSKSTDRDIMTMLQKKDEMKIEDEQGDDETISGGEVNGMQAYLDECSQDEVEEASEEEESEEQEGFQDPTEDRTFQGATVSAQNLIESSIEAEQPVLIDKELSLTRNRKYTGHWKQGLPEGKGVLKYPDGSYYDGEWKNGLYDGDGVFVTAKGDEWRGKWHENELQGEANCKYANGYIYKGSSSKRQPEGFGIMVYDNDDRYQGYWHSGKQSGYGQLFFEDGSYYKGDFLDSQLHGEGQYFWKGQKRTYKGSWDHNRRDGKGVQTWKGETYSGWFKADKMHGKGQLTDRSGYKHTGQWQNGRKQGMFIVTSPKGNQQQQEYSYGNLVTQKRKASKPSVSLAESTP